ncbi:SMC s Flexible Hinge domain protein [Mycobacteroides abscessus]|nr:SMC s Flexible Hinge domain protein [Mycobacteroides abscessus]
MSIANERVAELQSAERQAERQIASLKARIDALAIGLERKDGSAWLAENRSGAGIFGSIAQLVKVRPGYQGAIATAMGGGADAVAAENPAAAHEAVKALKSSDGGRAAIVFGDWPAHTGARPAVTLPPGAHWPTIWWRRPSGWRLRCRRCSPRWWLSTNSVPLLTWCWPTRCCGR